MTYQRVVADRLEEVATKRTLDDVLDLKVFFHSFSFSFSFPTPNFLFFIFIFIFIYFYF